MIQSSDTIFRGKSYGSLDGALRAMVDEIEISLDKLPQIMREELLAYLQRVAKNTTDRFIPFSKRNKGQQKELQIRSGETKQLIKSSPRARNVGKDLVEGSIGGPKHLEINEFGGIELPKPGDKYVFIPLDAALTNKGIPIAKNPKNWRNTFIRKTKKGNLIMFQRRPNKQIVPLYVLKPAVRIPPRLKMTRAINAAAPYFEKKLFDRIEKVF